MFPIPTVGIGGCSGPEIMNFRLEEEGEEGGRGADVLIKCSYHDCSPMPNCTVTRLNCCFWKYALPGAHY